MFCNCSNMSALFFFFLFFGGLGGVESTRGNKPSDFRQKRSGGSRIMIKKQECSRWSKAQLLKCECRFFFKKNSFSVWTHRVAWKKPVFCIDFVGYLKKHLFCIDFVILFSKSMVAVFQFCHASLFSCSAISQYWFQKARLLQEPHWVKKNTKSIQKKLKSTI